MGTGEIIFLNACNIYNNVLKESSIHNNALANKNSMIYWAIDNFTASKKSQLSFKKGDFLTVEHMHTSGWWYGTSCNTPGTLGWIPSTYLEILNLPIGATCKEDNCQCSKFQFNYEIPNKCLCNH